MRLQIGFEDIDLKDSDVVATKGVFGHGQGLLRIVGMTGADSLPLIDAAEKQAAAGSIPMHIGMKIAWLREMADNNPDEVWEQVK